MTTDRAALVAEIRKRAHVMWVQGSQRSWVLLDDVLSLLTAEPEPAPGAPDIPALIAELQNRAHYYQNRDTAEGQLFLAAADALTALSASHAALKQKASGYHRRAQQAEAAIAAKDTGGNSLGRMLANAGYQHWKERAEAAEAQVTALTAARDVFEVAIKEIASGGTCKTEPDRCGFDSGPYCSEHQFDYHATVALEALAKVEARRPRPEPGK
jgi:hypothetical protein